MRRLLIPAFIFASAALAQVPPRPESLDLPAPGGPSGGVDLKVLRAARAPLVLTAPVPVRSFRLTGDVLFQTEITALLAPWTNRELGSEDIAKAVEAVTAYLRARGLLVAQAFVPMQQIRDGVVEMIINGGRIGEVRLEVAEGTRTSRAMAERFLEPIRAGETIRRDNVEQSLLLLNDLPGTRLSASLTPGAEGSADLAARLENEGNPVTGRLTLDNAGVRGLGEYRGILDLRAPSPLGFGDLLSARLLRTSEGGQTLGILTYGMPVNGAGTRVGIRYGEQRYRLGKEFAPLHANGDARAQAFLASHPLVRRVNANLTLGASYSEIEYQDRIDSVGSISDSQHRIAQAGFVADSRDGWLGGGLNYLQVLYYRGKIVLLTPTTAAFDSGPDGLGTAGMFNKWRLRAQRNQAVDTRSSLIVSLRGQFASKNLEAGEEIQLTGPDGVRAYPAGEIYADEGYVASAEYRRAFELGVPIELSLFYDAAHARIDRSPPPGEVRNERNLSGYGIGAYVAPLRDAWLQAWLAWRASHDQPVTAPDRKPRVWLSLVMRF
jgi:hemolysin activation/secretion protein